MMAVMVIIAVVGCFFTPESEGLWELSENINFPNVAWMITATIFVLMMTPGLSFFYGGMVRKKNIISTILQSIIAMGVISVLWVVVGFSLAFGDDMGGVLGDPTTYLFFQNVGGQATDELSTALGITIPLALYALFQMKFAIITPSLITGSFAERVRFSAYIVFMVLFCIFVYCPLAHCTWHPDGLFGAMHVKDFAGGIVVHASSGVAALVGAIFLGKRRDSQHSEPANVPYVILGASLLWLGWFGFNAGSSLAADGVAVKAFLNTNTAAATAMLVWVFFDCLRGRKPSAMGAAIGGVVGLVAITPSAGWVSVGDSIMIALITTLVCNMACHWKNRTSVDDALDVFPTHGVGGIVGTLLTGVFVYKYEPGLAAEGVSHFTFFINHVIAVAIVFVYTFVVTYGLYWITNKMIPMRVSEDSEKIGLDRSQHDEHYGRLRELAEYYDDQIK